MHLDGAASVGRKHTTMMRTLITSAFAVILAPSLAQADQHAIAMHGTPKYGADYQHFDYVNPAAPKGGSLVLGRTGSFDSLHPFIVRGVAAAGLGLTYQALLHRSWDEPFSLYALLAESVRMAEDRSWVEFRLRQGAKFHDGNDVTIDDVVFSLRTLGRHGRPNHRRYYREVQEVLRPAPRTIRFHFGSSANRELPLILGLMPILPRQAFAERKFDKVSLKPIPGTGAYRVDRVDPGRAIAYRRLPNHWSDGLPAARGQYNFDTVRFEYFRDEDARWLAFQRGAVHLRREDDPRRWALAYDFPAAQRGQVRLEELTHGRPAGMYALVWNSRRAQFQDPRVRRALGQAFDFAWINKTFFHGAYRRTASFFANSYLASTGMPTVAEQTLLAPYRETLPRALFERPYIPPGDARLGTLRQRLKHADATLRDAGWVVRDLRRVNAATGTPFAFEIMLAHRADERLALSLAKNLERLGIEARVRTVDSSQYQERLGTFDFDAILYRWGQSLSPGNEQAFYWASSAARQTGSRNYPGIEDPAVDALIQRLTGAPTRHDLVTAARALDRVLLSGDHVLPLYHATGDRLAYWDRFGRPATTPLYGYRLETWWQDAEKAARLRPQ